MGAWGRGARLLLLLLDLGAQLGRLLVEVLVALLARLELRGARLLRVELLHLRVRRVAPLELPRGLRHLRLDVGRAPLHLRLRLGHLRVERAELLLGGERGGRARLAVVVGLLRRHLAARDALEQLLLLVRRGAALGLQQGELGAHGLELLLGLLDAPLVRGEGCGVRGEGCGVTGEVSSGARAGQAVVRRRARALASSSRRCCASVRSESSLRVRSILSSSAFALSRSFS